MCVYICIIVIINAWIYGYMDGYIHTNTYTIYAYIDMWTDRQI